ncbi:glutamine amidotransferase [Noviherbaspirillum sedimenti]|uniref:Glutamine amidotransferase n=1 Tax=Noviherbaspirillum sedimenti TaxID=2320865 RepID=A0A3A3G7L2_9BURK|nr:glutamine amidotransferase [Noviherbaspirillum sedimenti]RJG04408.1 glutamine amidotransferase [Noviherbaspirillum sedimenti]
MKSLIVFKVGETFDGISEKIGDFEEWIISGIGPLPLPIHVVDPRNMVELPSIATVAAAIVTGSHSMVTDRASWSESLAAWLRSAISEDIPVLGICYGHQLLAQALGGEVGDHPDGIELGTIHIKLTNDAKNDALFESLPEEFAAQAVHRQSVRRLPERAVLLASNAFEPHHAFRVGQSAWGVQFHPEFSPAAMSGYINELANQSVDGESCAEASSSKVLPTLEAATILPKFAKVVCQRMEIGK